MGIIFNIPAQLSDGEPKEYISSPVPIYDFIRVKTRDRENKENFINTTRVERAQIPSEIVFLYTKVKVSP